jgi:hypothetical protein
MLCLTIYGYAQKTPCESFIASLVDQTNYGKYVTVKDGSIKEQYIVYDYKVSREMMMTDGQFDSTKFTKMCRLDESIYLNVGENEVMQVYLNRPTSHGEVELAIKTRVSTLEGRFVSMIQEHVRVSEKKYEVKKVSLIHRKHPKILVETESYQGDRKSKEKKRIKNQKEVQAFIDDMSLIYGFFARMY